MTDTLPYANDDTTVLGQIVFDTVGSDKVAVSKIILGADTVNDGFVSSTNPLPVAGAVTISGVATAANQATEIASLASIDGKTPALVGGGVPVSLPAGLATSANQATEIAGLASIDSHVDGLETLGAAGNASLSSMDTKLSNQATAAKQDTGNTSLASVDTKLTGQATAANQATGNASLASLDVKAPALGQALVGASVPVVLPISQITALTPPTTVAVTGVSTAAKQDTIIAGLSSIDGHVDGLEGTTASIDAKITACNTGAVVVSSSALPTGGSTAARQDAGNTSLGSIDAKTPALGQALAAAAVPVVLTAIQQAALTPPAAITGFATETTVAAVNTKTPSLGQALAAASVPVVLTALQLASLTAPVLAAGANVIGSLAANQSVNNAQINGVTPLMGNGVTGTGSQRVTIASDNTPVAFKTDQTTHGTTDLVAADTTKIAGTAIDVNSGNKSAGTQRVVLATDQPTLPANSVDPTATSGSLTAADAASTSTTNSAGQTIVTGNPTAGSSVSVAVTGHTAVTLQLSGTANTTCTFERSIDGGTTWLPFPMEELGVGASVSSLAMSDNKAYVFRGNCGGLTNVRVRCTTYGSGTVTAKIQPSWGVSQVPVNQGTPNAAANAWPTVDTPATSGGLSVSSFLSTAAVQATAVKASPGQVFALEFFNIGSTPMYVRLYNQTASPAAGDNANIIWRGVIPGNTAGAGIVKSWEKGLPFSTGIGMRCTGGISDTDNTSLAASTVIGNIDYK